MTGAGHVFVSRDLGPPAMARLRAAGHPVRTGVGGTRDDLLDAVTGAAGVVALLSDRVDAELLDRAGPDLRVVANLAVGYDNVDLAATAERDVVVANTPDVLTDSTADLTLALLLAVERRLLEADAVIRSGGAWAWEPRWLLGRDLTGLRLGVVGFGRIGRAVARRAQAFGMEVVARRSRSAADAGLPDDAQLELAELLATSDVVTLHCPLTPDTHHLVGEAELASMKRDAVLLNTSRGPLIDEAALVRALRGGRLRGAGLDVFEHEPQLAPGLRELDNVVLTPHVGSAGVQTRDAMALLAVDNVLAVLDGRAPLTPVRTT